MSGTTVDDPARDEAQADPTDPHEGRTLGRSSLINLVGFAAFGLSGFAFTVVVTRRLGPTGAGAVMLAIAVFSIVSRSAMAGTDVGLVRFTSRFLAKGRHRELPRLYRAALLPVAGLSTVAGLAVFALAEPLGELLGTEGTAEDLTRYLQVLAPFIPIACLYQVIEGGSRGFGSMVPSVVVERIGRSAALPIAVLLVLVTGGGVAAVGLAWAGPFLVAFAVMAVWTTRLVRRSGEAAPDDAPEPLDAPEVTRRLWHFALPRALAGVFALSITWVDTLLLGALADTSDVGVYTASIRWLLVGNVAGNAVTLAFGPQISAVMTREGPTGGRRLFQSATTWLILLAWPAYLTAMVFAPLLLRAFGSDFASGANAADGTSVILITGLGFLFAAATGPVDMLLLMAGRSRLSLINTGVALVVNVVANLVLIPPFGVRGAAAAWMISLIVANGLPTVQMWRELGIGPWGPRSVRALVVAAGAGVALLGGRALLGPTLPGLAVGLVAAGAVVLAGVLTAPDRLGVADVLGRAPR